MMNLFGSHDTERIKKVFGDIEAEEFATLVPIVVKSKERG